MSLTTDLMKIGFTEYEAKVYLALLQENPATGYHLSKKSGMPRSMVYEALGRLDGHGAVLKTEDRRAVLYRPVPPDVLLDRYRQEHRELMQTLRTSLRALFNSQEEDRIWSIRGRNSIISYAAQMIEAADREVYLVLNDVDLEELRERIVSASESQVDIRALLTGDGQLDCGQVARHPPMESELQELTATLVVVVDGKQALIASTGLETTATITNNSDIILIARQFVWMELFAQRVYTRLGPELLERLDPEDRSIFTAPEGVPEV
ncbi:MAG: helix-turn-helix domain-containing protein [Anaerolineales bacterium]|jgi:Cd2+/Zn2+-exporting ATPase